MASDGGGRSPMPSLPSRTQLVGLLVVLAALVALAFVRACRDAALV